ncbi:uncharacterized protein TNCT_310251 [Trichonephila clavata]|uniref:Uncharacterized protein n=1 Tax=Trichonephila clavata TaxID=2740835 RepID=A0A8X6LF33_TRICU|nr:uncharacterized protein TNCT_310251 [Trichonephila clavata]
MGLYQFLVVLIAVGAVICDTYTNETFENVLDAPREPRDRFRLMVSNVDEQRVSDEIQDFTNYDCERMVVIRNKAKDPFRLTCQSYHDTPKTLTIKPDNAFVFTFKPQKNGNTKFWCTVEYKMQFARFDVYNEALSYMCPRAIKEVYQYTVNHDGVHVDGDGKKNEGTKIRALFKGHNKFILWEEFHNNETDGFLYSGLVDGGMCSDIPEQFNDKPAAVTVCYNHCVHLYEHYGCRGEVQTIQANDDCIDVGLISDLSGKLSAIKGC